MVALRYFKLEEFDCKETGENKMDPHFLFELDRLRGECGFPFRVVSGYRSPEHSVERVKRKPGQHSKGLAADIAVSNGRERMAIVRHATRLGFTGIGVHKEFVHVDRRRELPVLWVY